MSTKWKYAISIATQDKVTGNILANAIPNAGNDPNADHFSGGWKKDDNTIWYTTHSRMTKTGYDALIALISSGEADEFLSASHIQHGLADGLVRHADWIVSLGLMPDESL